MTADKMSDHDLLIEMHTDIKTVKADISDIKEGRTPNCVAHNLRLNNHWTHIKAIWGVLGAVGLALFVGAIAYLGKLGG